MGVWEDSLFLCPKIYTGMTLPSGMIRRPDLSDVLYGDSPSIHFVLCYTLFGELPCESFAEGKDQDILYPITCK